MAILISGTSRGIGLSIAKKFLLDGSMVYGLSREPGELYEHPNFIYVPCDFANFSDACKKIREIETNEFTGIIHCAGLNIIKPIDTYHVDEITEMININVLGAVAMVQGARDRLINNKSKVIFISSVWSKKSKKFRAIYSMTKSGLNGLARGLAIEFAEKKISVNVLSPGFVDTQLTRKSLTKTQLNEILNNVPTKDLIQTTEIADSVKLLYSMPYSFTGQNVFVDGGFSVA